MKLKSGRAIGLTTIWLMLPAAADVIYSNLRNIAIPATYAGVYLDVDGSNGWNADMFNPVAGWDINPFFGGQTVANSPAFQPVRSGTGSMDPIVNLATGASIGGGSMFSTFSWDHDNNPMTPDVPGYGGSQTHLGNGAGQFADGSDGYIGFRLNDNYGWMRVVLGGATPVIKDWAYDTGGGSGSIVTGNVLQDGNTVTLNSALGSFTLGSQITGSNSIVKTGANSATLTGSNNYAGTITVANGTLLLNGSISGSGAVGVDAAATLGGSGTVGGTVTVDGTLSPGASIGKLTVEGDLNLNAGSTFAYEMNPGDSNSGDLQIVEGALNLAQDPGDKVYLTLDNPGHAAFGQGTTLSLIQYTGPWNGGFFTSSVTGELLGNGASVSDGYNNWTIRYGVDSVGAGLNFANELGGRFITLSLTAIPEPSSLLALGCLVSSGVFLRSRRRDRAGTSGLACR